ncbi:hypothetical protein FGRA07_10373 [Fusarium graminearum]|nr:hypothetical protein FGRA07_10373 [Fusarium graminearum]
MYASYLVDQKVCKALKDVVDSDVAGWGVITAFTAAIFLNLCAIVTAYLLFALPITRYQPVDRLFLEIIGIHIPHDQSTSDHHTNTQKHEGTASAPPTPDSPEQSTVSRPISESTHRVTTGRKWSSASKALILGMSDQQLFTGMALIIPMLLMTGGLHGLNESLSVYSFKVVTMLAYFSFIIQLCSLTVIPDGVSEKQTLRYFRASVMLLFLLLLISCMVISQSVTFRFNSNVSVKCALQNLHMVDPQRPGYTFFSDEAIIFFNLLVLIAIIVLEYLRRVRGLLNPDSRDSDNITTPMNEPTNDSAIELMTNSATEAITNPIDTGTMEHRFWLHLGLENFESSFLLELIWMLFYFTFGLANLCKFLVDQQADIGAIEPSFGQLVPIFLLAHPFISASEAFPRPSFNLNRSSTLQRQDIPSPFASKATLLCVVFVYASILVIWALMFAAVIPDAYPLTALACLYTAVTHRRIYWKYVRKFFNAVWIFLKFLCNFTMHYWDSCKKKTT